MAYDLKTKLKRFFGIIGLLLFAYFFYSGVGDLIEQNNQVGQLNTIDISGYLNNVSSFVLFGFILPAIPFGLFSLITGVMLPKLAFRVMLIGSIVGWVTGHYYDSTIRDNLVKFKYQECVSERNLALKYSSRTYVLPSIKCPDGVEHK